MPAEHCISEDGNGHCGKVGKIDAADALYEIGSIWIFFVAQIWKHQDEAAEHKEKAHSGAAAHYEGQRGAVDELKDMSPVGPS